MAERIAGKIFRSREEVIASGGRPLSEEERDAAIAQFEDWDKNVRSKAGPGPAAVGGSFPMTLPEPSTTPTPPAFPTTCAKTPASKGRLPHTQLRHSRPKEQPGVPSIWGVAQIDNGPCPFEEGPMGRAPSGRERDAVSDLWVVRRCRFPGAPRGHCSSCPRSRYAPSRLGHGPIDFLVRTVVRRQDLGQRSDTRRVFHGNLFDCMAASPGGRTDKRRDCRVSGPVIPAIVRGSTSWAARIDSPNAWWTFADLIPNPVSNTRYVACADVRIRWRLNPSTARGALRRCRAGADDQIPYVTYVDLGG